MTKYTGPTQDTKRTFFLPAQSSKSFIEICNILQQYDTSSHFPQPWHHYKLPLHPPLQMVSASSDLAQFLNFFTSLFRDLLEAGGGALATPYVGAGHLMMRMRQEKEKELGDYL